MLSYKKFLELTNKELPQEALKDIIEIRRNSFYDPQKNAEWATKHNIDFVFTGRFLGEKKKDFIPSPYGVEHASKQAQNNQKVVLNEKAAWLFICGRDAFGSAVVRGKPKKNRIIYLYDTHDNLLGMGQWLVNDLTTKQAEQAVIKNLYDKGRYIRQEK